jgi:hypothetical protein
LFLSLLLPSVLGAQKLNQNRDATNDIVNCNNNRTSTIECQCPCYPHDGSGARIAYLITIHNKRTLADSVSLVQSISAPRTIILIHIDTKLSTQEYETSELNRFVHNEECARCGSKIIVDSLFNLEWGQWSMNHPTLWGMELLTTSSDLMNQWDVFINLSADTVPIYTPQVLSQLFDPMDKSGILHNINFVTSSSCVTGLLPTNVTIFPQGWHKRSHYSTNPTSDFVMNYLNQENGEHGSVTLTIHFGSQWMILTPEFVNYITTSLRRPDSLPSQFRDELILRRKLMSDETFIPTLLVHHEKFRETLPQVTRDGSLIGTKGMYSVRYERMDEHVPDAFGNVVHQQRYDVPPSAGVEVPRPWGPYYLGLYDLGSIKDSGALFARKVSKRVDANIFNFLPVNDREEIPSIHWPDEIKIIPKVDWDEFRRQYASKRRHNDDKEL